MTRERPVPIIAFQGIPGAFSHGAGQLYAGTMGISTEPEFLPCSSFDELFKKVEAGEADYGMVPLENSSAGSISVNYDLLWSSMVAMVGEISIPVHHQLIGLSGARAEELLEIYSHPAALDQCKRLFKELSQARAVPFFDTSGAARFIMEAQNPAFAAIAGEAAAKEHGLQVIRRNVEDYPENSTRFGVIVPSGKAAEHALTPLPDSYKLSCAMELPDRPGSLAKLLSELAKLQVNPTKIEPRPVPECPFTYRFFLDLSLPDRNCDILVVHVLEECTASLKILGRYRRFQR